MMIRWLVCSYRLHVGFCRHMHVLLAYRLRVHAGALAWVNICTIIY